MPVLQLKLFPAQPAHRCAELARSLTALTGALLGKNEEVTAVLIAQPPHWFVGGTVPARPTALVEIDITQGTNSVEDKDAYIATVHAELRRQLGELAEASYVVVREVPATDWGWGGRTQAARRLARNQEHSVV